MSKPLDRYGQLYGGLMIMVNDIFNLKPITFPFDQGMCTRGNHVKPHDMVTVNSFDYWHSGVDDETRNVFVNERGMQIDSRMIGHNANQMLREMTHRVLTVNHGIKIEDRLSMLNTVTNIVFPQLHTPAVISMAVQSSQSKFILFSRDLPIYFNVFCDDNCMLLLWTNEPDVEARMREHYGERFSVFRMKPILNSVLVLHSYYLKKRITRWRYQKCDRLELLNRLEALISRKSKGDSSDAHDITEEDREYGEHVVNGNVINDSRSN